MPLHIEPFAVWLLADGGEMAADPACGTGLARLLRQWLERCRLPAGTLEGIEARGQVWLTDAWQAEMSVNGERRVEAAERDRGQHLMCRLLEGVARPAGLEALPRPVLAALEDYATTVPAALLACWQAAGSEGEAQRRAWRRAFELDPAMTAPRAALAGQALDAGQAAAAAALLAGVTVQDPERACELGLGLWSAGETAAAGALLETAVQSNPDDAIALAALAAWLARHAGDNAAARDEALLLATQATQRASDDYRTWQALADVHRAGGDFEQANFYYGFALKLEPAAPALLKDAAATLLMAGEPRAALPLIERALETSAADADHHGNLAFARHLLGEKALALAAARRASALRPDDARLRVLEGELALAAGEREAALDAWARATELDPTVMLNPEGGNLAPPGRGDGV